MSNLTVMDKGLVERMLRLEIGRSDEALNERFGISYNTWRKIIDGRPIRPSTADRLIRRIQTIDKQVALATHETGSGEERGCG